MLKRLWSILGPVFCALLLVLLLILLYPSKKDQHDFSVEKKDAVALSETSFKNSEKKIRALTDSEHPFVAFFGSSEWKRIDSMHPSVLAEAYDRPYRPYLLGQRGTASLSHYFGMQSIAEELVGKKAVYVISPQWFTPKGANKIAFKRNFSSDQLVSFLQTQTGSESDRYAAQRLLEVNPDLEMKGMVEKVAQGEELSTWDRQVLAFSKLFLEKEESLFGQFSQSNTYEKEVLPKVETLPKDFSYQALEDIAISDGKKLTSNNDFGIYNEFYSQRLEGKLEKLKGFQKKETYLLSSEYNDLQLALSEFAKQDTDVMFIIPPVNAKWMAYTGLSPEMYQQTVDKIKFQLTSQGFTKIADFSKEGDQPYFMQDTIHMGWTGWLAFDKAVAPFLTEKQERPQYQLSDQFLTKEWANHQGSPEDFR